MCEGLIITNREKKFEFVNEAFCRMVGVPAENLLGTSPYDIMDESSSAILDDAFSNLQGSLLSSNEAVLKCADGNRKIVWVSSVPRVIEGEMVGTIAVISDFTKRKVAEEKLRRRNQIMLKLQAASSSITASLELGFVLETAAQELVDLLDVDHCQIFEWDQWARSIHLIGSYPLIIGEESSC